MSAAVRREVVIDWAGARVTFVPDFALLMRIEAQGLSLLQMAADINAGRAMMGQMSLLVAACLAAGGVKVSAEEVLAELLGPSTVTVVQTARQILRAFFPDTDEKKPVAPASQGTMSRGKARAAKAPARR